MTSPFNPKTCLCTNTALPWCDAARVGFSSTAAMFGGGAQCQCRPDYCTPPSLVLPAPVRGRQIAVVPPLFVCYPIRRASQPRPGYYWLQYRHLWSVFISSRRYLMVNRAGLLPSRSLCWFESKIRDASTPRASGAGPAHRTDLNQRRRCRRPTPARLGATRLARPLTSDCWVLSAGC